jgi:hypothetical protein
MSLASLSSLVYFLQVSSEPTRVKHLQMLHSKVGSWLHTNIRLGWKGLSGSNTLAYYENLLITTVKSFIGLAKVFESGCSFPE